MFNHSASVSSFINGVITQHWIKRSKVDKALELRLAQYDLAIS